jgi:tetratricopeptide (TPR) repeat protein
MAGLGISLAMIATLSASAPGQAGDSGAGEPGAGHGRILLVLPFDNRSSQPSLEWVREAAAEILSSRFSSAGFQPMSRPERMYALDHLGLPEGFHPSRATALKVAETLDADSIVVGSFTTEGTSFEAEAQVVDVPHLKMSRAISARGELKNMGSVFDSLAWQLTRQMDPQFSVAEETFLAAGKGLRLDAFEQYIRGITEPDQAERLRHLNQAVTLSPGFGPAWMALGREEYNGQQYEQAAQAFAKVGGSDPDALEAGFYRGLSLVFSGGYPQAEAALAAVARVLPLAQVLNNEGVAVSRQGHDATELFMKAVDADPNNADYHFNLALALKRHGSAAAARAELAQCRKLRPNDGEAAALEAEWKEPARAAAADDAAKADPLERIARSFDAVAFRQAAQMLDQMDTSRLAALGPQKQAEMLAAQARDYLDRGLLLEAERLYLSAITVDDRVAAAHVGLAEVRERTGDAAAARKEAKTALELAPSVDAYLVMGRVEIGAGHWSEAGDAVEKALKLEPGNGAALELKKRVEAKR